MVDVRVCCGCWKLRGAEITELAIFVVVAGQTRGMGVTRADAALLRVGASDSLLAQPGRSLSSLLRNRRRATCNSVIARYYLSD